MMMQVQRGNDMVYNIQMLANYEKLNAILIFCSCLFLQDLRPPLTTHDVTTPLIPHS